MYHHVWLPDCLQQVCGALASQCVACQGQTAHFFYDYGSLRTGLEAHREPACSLLEASASYRTLPQLGLHSLAAS